MPVRLEHNSYWVPGRKGYTFYLFERMSPIPRVSEQVSAAPIELAP